LQCEEQPVLVRGRPRFEKVRTIIQDERKRWGVIDHVPDGRTERAAKLEVKAMRGGENELSPPWTGVCKPVPSLQMRPTVRAEFSIVIKDFEEDVVGECVYRFQWEVFGEYFDVVSRARDGNVSGTYSYSVRRSIRAFVCVSFEVAYAPDGCAGQTDANKALVTLGSKHSASTPQSY